MSDLISRTQLILDIDEIAEGNPYGYNKIMTLNEVLKEINNQQTAYNVNQVISELKSHSNNEKMATSKLFDGKHRYYRAISVTKAINIVKRGGVDE